MDISLKDTATLLGVKRRLPIFQPFLLMMFFPIEKVFGTKYIDFDEIDERLKLAPFVAPKVQGQIMRKEGMVTKRFSPAYVKPKHDVDLEQTIERQAGESYGGSLSPAERRDAIIVDNLKREDASIKYRMEWMATQVLLKGMVTVSGKDYPTQIVDFERDASLTEIKVGEATWDPVANADTADPLQDLEDMATLTDSPVTDVIMDRLAFNDFQKFPAVRELLNNQLNQGIVSDIDLGPSNGEQVQLKGNVNNFRIWVYTGYYHDDDDNKVFFIPDYTVILGSQAIEGVQAYGAIMSASSGMVESSQFPRDWIDPNTDQEYTETQSAPLTIPKFQNSSACLTVR